VVLRLARVWRAIVRTETFRRLCAAAILAFMPATAPAGTFASCAGKEGGPCAVPLGEYWILLPKVPEGAPIFLHFHGGGGAALGVLGMTEMVQTALDRGYAVLAPQGVPSNPDRPRNSWNFRGEAERRNELEYTRQVLDDAAARFGLDRNRVLMSGFSIGGSLTWYLACADPAIAAAYAPVSGGFWRELPTTCAGPVKLLHTHGWRDQTVPLEGRPLRPSGPTRIQGDIWQGMQIWRAANGCDGLRADEFEDRGQFWIRRWTACAPGTALEFALFPGDHRVPEGWTDMALDWFETVAPPASAPDRPSPAALTQPPQ